MANVAIVTGSGQGIGKAIALRLAADGMGVMVADINAKQAKAVVEEICAGGGQAIWRQADVADAEAVKSMVAATVERFGTVDVLVNNAGITAEKQDFADYAPETWQRIFSVNVFGSINCANQVIPILKAKKSGRIINMSSQSAYTGGLRAPAPYSASKAAIICITKSMASELGQYHITVNAVAPGYITTPMTTALKYDVADVALKRMGLPEDIADAVAFLASDDSRYVTGMTLDVNGGTIMR